MTVARRALVFVACTLIVTAVAVGLDLGASPDTTAGSQTCDGQPCDPVAVPVGAIGVVTLSALVGVGYVVAARARRKGRE